MDPAQVSAALQILLDSTTSQDPIGLCGFEGPEKLLEIWFSSSSQYLSSNNSNLSLNAISPDCTDDENFFTTTSSNDINRVSDDASDDIATCDSSRITIHHDHHQRKEGLRKVPREKWEQMLELVKAQILSSIHNQYTDAYLLSESSMFISEYRLVLKTCGTTTLLSALPRILEIARDYADLDKVHSLFYSRKSFLFPEKQIFPHGDWSDEVDFLDDILPSSEFETAAYILGKINGDHWFLYTASSCTTVSGLLTPPTSDDEEMQSSASITDNDVTQNIVHGSSIILKHQRDQVMAENDQLNKDLVISAPHYPFYMEQDEDEEDEDDVTLEIMMTNLDPEAMKVFWKHQSDEQHTQGENKGPNRMSLETGISSIYLGAKIDDHTFDPCGYSMNGLLGPYYFTIHVTPEDHCSYASFETTFPVKKLKGIFRDHGVETEYNTFEDVVTRVLKIFRPGTFSTTFFTHRSVMKRFGMQGTGLFGEKRKCFAGFRLKDRIVQGLGRWELVFMHFAEDKKSLNRSTKQPLKLKRNTSI